MKPTIKMNTANDQQARLDALIARIETHQDNLRLSDKQFASRYSRHLGSAKSWRHRLVARDWAALGTRLDKWEAQLTKFVTELDGGAGAISIVEIPILRHTRALYEQLQGQGSDRRFAVILGKTGTGKSQSLRTVHRECTVAQKTKPDVRGQAVYLEADETWKENKTRCIEGIALALGIAPLRTASATFHSILEHLKANPLTLLIDEFHEGGVLLMKLCKTIINKTRAKILAASYPTGWNRLTNGSTDAYNEAQQLLGRTLKPIVRVWDRGCTVDDLTIYLDRAAGLNGQARYVADRIHGAISSAGNLRDLADALELAEANAAELNIEVDADLIEQAVAAIASK